MVRHFLKSHIWLMVRFVIFAVLSMGAMSGISIFKQVLIDALIAGDTGLFVQVLLYSLGFVLVGGVLFFSHHITMQKIRVAFKKTLRYNVYNGVMKRNPVDFDAQDTGEYISALTNDITSVSSFMSMSLTLAASAVSVVIGVGIMLSYNVVITGIAIGCALLSMFLPLLFTGMTQRAQLKISESNSAFSVTIKELFNGHGVVSAFGIFAHALSKFTKHNQNLAKAEFGYEKISVLSFGSSVTLGHATSFVIVAVAGIFVMQGYLTIGDIVLFSSLSGSLSSSAIMLMQLVPHIRGTKPILEKLNNLTVDTASGFKGTKAPSLNHGILVKDLTFGYNEDTKVLKNVHLQLNKGEKIALLGASGSGKSTFAKLIAGNYQDFNGEISFDGVDIRELDAQAFRKMVAVIPQNVYVFNDTIYNNICLGDTFSPEDFNKAIEISGVAQFVQHMPHGVGSQCSELGSNLSGGQRQRIAIARAVIRNAKLLILDEGVSAVDIQAANEIEQALLDMKELTLLTITHRVKDGLNDRYDRVLEMKNGGF